MEEDDAAKTIVELTKKYDQSVRKLNQAMNEYKEKKDKEEENADSVLDELEDDK